MSDHPCALHGESIAVMQNELKNQKEDIQHIFDAIRAQNKVIKDHMANEEEQRAELLKQITQIKYWFMGSAATVSALITIFEVFLR